MKIAVFVPALVNKGPVIVAQHLVKGLLSIGYRPDIIYFDKLDELDFLGCETKSVRSNLIEWDSYDVIHTHGLRPDIYMALFKHRISGTLVSTQHNYIFEDLSLQYGKVIAFLAGVIWLIALRRFTKVVVFTNDMKRYYQRYLSNKSIFVVPNGLDINRVNVSSLNVYNEIISFRQSYPLIISLGSLIPRKNYSFVIGLSELMPEYRFLIVGDGPDHEKLTLEINNKNLQERVKIIKGFSDARQLLQLADCHLMASKSEGFPLVFVEACFFGVPTVTNPLPFITESFENYDNYCFKTDDITSAARTIQHVINNHTHLKKDVTDLYCNKLSHTMMTNEYVSVYFRP
jgi:L-malate glycosyltransferase